MINPTYPAPSPWAAALTTKLDSLKKSAEQARNAHNSARTASDALTAELRVSESASGTVVAYDGHSRNQQTEVLREIAFSHCGLTMSLSRVWHRAAYAYAYAVSCLLVDLTVHGQEARVTVSHSADMPVPPLDTAGIRQAHRQAVTAQLPVISSEQPYGATPWARSADAWHQYAETADAHLRTLLTAAHAQTQSGR
ncbi:hypothetical protein [Streptomyces sp. NPDC057966]|uniref:hypothetical protein n=1 Tax=Streptomyces sp. NPDC057966 TaxID=3346292 RepID=UPI0036E56443